MLTPDSVREWTVTGVYGTGKSAFAHFIASLSGRKDERIQNNAQDILKSYNKSCLKSTKQLPANGFVKAIATSILTQGASQREPIAVTLVRGLYRGLHLWNELINRSELTSQGAKARRELYDAMLNKSGEELLGLTGYGPEHRLFQM